MMLTAALALAAQASVAASSSPPSPVFSDGIGQIGMYLPNSQLLDWCVGEKITDIMRCEAFIMGVAEASGMIDAGFPQGPIDTSTITPMQMATEPRNMVIAYLKRLPNTRMSSPAARSVYAALVAAYPYTGRHKDEIPLRTATSR